MSKINQMRNVKDVVEALLIAYPKTKDSDDSLVAMVYYKTIGKEQISQMNAVDLLRMISNGDLPKFENISRCRRKLQEEREDLRGETYKERHKLDTEVRKGIASL